MGAAIGGFCATIRHENITYPKNIIEIFSDYLSRFRFFWINLDQKYPISFVEIVSENYVLGVAVHSVSWWAIHGKFLPDFVLSSYSCLSSTWVVLGFQGHMGWFSALPAFSFQVCEALEIVAFLSALCIVHKILEDVTFLTALCIKNPVELHHVWLNAHCTSKPQKLHLLHRRPKQSAFLRAWSPKSYQPQHDWMQGAQALWRCFISLANQMRSRTSRQGIVEPHETELTHIGPDLPTNNFAETLRKLPDRKNRGRKFSGNNCPIPVFPS